jgi:hypothetical protein
MTTGRQQTKERAVDDKKITDDIDGLAREEHELFERQSNGTATDADRDRLRQIELMLDQCWDLLRQRRARREFGLDPDEARIRDKKTVEGYSG